MGEVTGEKVGEEAGKVLRTEEYHLEGVDPIVKENYQTIKTSLLDFKPSLRFNPQKYYISIIDKKNFAFIYIRKKKQNITVVLPERVIRDSNTNQKVRACKSSTEESVQQ